LHRIREAMREPYYGKLMGAAASGQRLSLRIARYRETDHRRLCYLTENVIARAGAPSYSEPMQLVLIFMI
jgi:hypothetical protein